MNTHSTLRYGGPALEAIDAQRDKDMHAALARYPRAIDLMAAGAAHNPAGLALVYSRGVMDENPVVLSHETLLGLIKAASTWFAAAGIGPSDVVAILVPASTAAIVTIWGASVASVAMPLNLLFTRDAIAAQLKATGAKLLVVPTLGTPGGLYERVVGLETEIATLQKIVSVPIDGSMSFDNVPLQPDTNWSKDFGHGEAASLDRVAVMLPTGGTTGHPKVAQLTNRNIIVSTLSSVVALDMHPGDRLLIALPLFHVGGLFVGTSNALAAGATIYVPSPAGARDPAYVSQFWNYVERHRITHAGNVPTVLGALADVPVDGADISSLRIVLIGASICPPEIERRFLALWGGKKLQQVYGMTEVAGAITHDFFDRDVKPMRVGTHNPLFELAILAGGKIHTAPWPSPAGELIVRGPQVFAGYVDAKQTEDAFYEGWLRTGDLCTIDADGYVEVAGRVKDVIIRGGHNIDPRMIEDAAMDFPGIALAAAVGRPDAYAGEVPMLFVMPQPGVTIDSHALGEFVSSRLDEPPARPRAVHVVSEMPLTPIGKIFKPKLREIAADGAARELLQAEGLSDITTVTPITDPARGLVLQVTVKGDATTVERTKRAMERFQVRSDVVAG